MIKLLFSGCSYTSGTGLPKEKQDESNYVNVFTREVFGNNAELTNIAMGGNSNLLIFLDACTEMLKNHYDYVFIGWTSYPRHVIWIGLEEYECRRTLNASRPLAEHVGNELTFSEKFLTDLSNKFSLVQNAHYDILNIIKYANILKNISYHGNTKVFFLNNMCHWDLDYFTETQKTIIPSNLTNYTNFILNSTHRDDPQIYKLYNKVHRDYADAGGIQQHRWLNLYNSFQSMIVDRGTDGIHPGTKSHQNYGSYLASKFNHQLTV